ncbi:CD2 antigen cytoplasmic tail-binding protein 2 homolog [Ctenocephalides felis]|uniref:CD2 antigen cytoplasmic tail-binding protein 2 homolog n=1 Tax=Ctenocephalides felis TaxID=7515 RepID=UPI000E6E4614|nr:CD2 antigen cytoplasmic tail-binding protein 2 homolog [Ctenocephalides felis]
MSTKRKLNDVMIEDGELLQNFSNKKQQVILNENKHSLDSDEDDSEDDFDHMDNHEIEGEEDCEIFKEGEVQITPFNMKEELQEGHFDNQGHYHWKKDADADLKDHWLDNIDWVKIKETTDGKAKIKEESDDDDEPNSSFDLIESYKKMLEFMKPNETVLKTLQRLGKSSKISSAQRWKNKKLGIVDPNAELVTNLTSLANEVLTKMGDMDIYQQTYEQIQQQIGKEQNKRPTASTELDMYADDFDEKEKAKMSSNVEEEANPIDDGKGLMWEFKWGTSDADQVHGPHSTEQMQEWVSNGYFKTGVWVRKVGSEGEFHTSNRIDFELYL